MYKKDITWIIIIDYIIAIHYIFLSSPLLMVRQTQKKIVQSSRRLYIYHLVYYNAVYIINIIPVFFF